MTKRALLTLTVALTAFAVVCLALFAATVDSPSHSNPCAAVGMAHCGTVGQR